MGSPRSRDNKWSDPGDSACRGPAIRFSSGFSFGDAGSGARGGAPVSFFTGTSSLKLREPALSARGGSVEVEGA